MSERHRSSISAGEASSDMYAARLATALRAADRRDVLRHGRPANGAKRAWS